ncbi:MAG: hypothetical protein NT034_04440 [Candidatus Magasanikbacteria bacterium]|nr:hypothetical protein [Candidatus Magasanikbacteria bacterium]
MKQNQLDRIIRLVKRTGDRFVILDRDTDEAMVVMNLNEYEDLLNTTAEVSDLAEEEMLSRLNHDINRWQEQNEKKATLPQIQYDEPEVEETEPEEPEPVEQEEKLPEVHNLPEVSEEIDDSELEDEEDGIEFAPSGDSVPQPPVEPVSYVAPTAPLNSGSAPAANFAEEDLSDLPEGEEEKFYLEPIE